jgi:AraC-like DNA-binding protein
MGAKELSVEEWESLARVANFRPAKMAALLNVTPKQLQRRFKLRFGETPEIWARRLRCRFARERIESGSNNKTVVSELKFTDQAHLCHEFHHFYGASPQSFALKRRMSH